MSNSAFNLCNHASVNPHSCEDEILIKRKVSFVPEVTWSNSLDRFCVVNEAGREIGYADLYYNPRYLTCEFDDVKLNEAYRGLGYGKAIYEEAARVASSRGGVSYTLISSSQLDPSAERVWDSLIRDGKAIEIPTKGRLRSFKMISLPSLDGAELESVEQ